jgi:pyruvate dehydrogenase E2 component (dihydrolipoamide acetyltransferase)
MTALTVPKLSMSGEPVRIVAWLAEDGAEVTRGQPVAELETEKSNVEIEAPADGVLRIVVAAGRDADVEQVIGLIEDGAESSISPVSVPTTESAVEDAATATGGEPSVEPMPRTVTASPAARRLAHEHGVQLELVAGSGPGGRITAADIMETVRRDGRADDGRLRDAVVALVTASWQTIPHIHIGGRLDGEGLAAARRGSRKYSVTDLLVFALARAVGEVPELNGTFNKMPELSSGVNISLAVATAHGVVAPTIRDAHELPLDSISAERERLVAGARDGSLGKRDLSGGTITLSNLGAYPVDFFAPVIAGPQICLVAAGRLQQEPVAHEGMIAIRHRLWTNAAIDHRAADGESGGRLLAALERGIAALPAVLDVTEGR